MKNVLVVGGAGYIGSHTCKALSTKGFKPIVYDNLSTGHRDAVLWGPLEHGDILDGARLDYVFRKYDIEDVIHFAAFAYVGESVSDPAKYYRNNVVGSLSLLDAMVRNDVSNIIFSSTCATYGIVEKLPITEETPQHPLNPYGYTKLVVENALIHYEAAYGLKWAALRYFNAAGLDPDGELGERHDPETHAIPLAINAALHQTPFQIYGDDYPTADGSAVRDYIHVNDLADAHVRALGYLNQGGNSTAFNLATGTGTSVKALVDAVSSAVGQSLDVHLSARRPGDPPELFATGLKAKNLLGWSPQYTGIRDIVDTAVAWFSRNNTAR